MWQSVDDLKNLRTPEAYQGRIVYCIHKADAMVYFKLSTDDKEPRRLIKMAENLLEEAKVKFPDLTFVMPKSLKKIQFSYMENLGANDPLNT